MYKIYLTPVAAKDKEKITKAGFLPKIDRLIELLKTNPYTTPPSYEKLVGNLDGFYSRRINIQHRLVYQVLKNEAHLKDPTGTEYDGIIKIIRMWSHYER
jgi:Txe/YoeB family toxin of toxin-antitoxin system